MDYQAVNGVVKLATARNAEEAEAAFHDFGAATSVIGLSVLGARASLKPVGVNTTGLSRLSATVQNIRSIPASLRMSWTAFRSGQWRSNFSQFGNQVSATVQAVRTSFRDGSWRTNTRNFVASLFQRNRSKPSIKSEIDQLIAGLRKTESEAFLTNMELLLKKMPVKDLLKNEAVLDILYQRYAALGHRQLTRAYLKARATIDENPLAVFRALEENLLVPRKPIVYNQQEPCKFHVARNIPGETVIDASHGGGWRYLKDFLSGKRQGYQLEKRGKGIQVSPNFRDRDIWYAERAVRGHFDSPAILRFRVQAQYLEGAVNGYEAGLTAENLVYIIDIQLTNLYTGQTITANNITELLAILQGLK